MHDFVLQMLREGEITVVFTKQDGTERRMRCTTNSSLMPENVLVESKMVYTHEQIRVWDLDKNEWRSFLVKSIKEVILNDKVEEKEKPMGKIVGKCSICSGEVIMPESWASSIPPKPSCCKCGATKKTSLPVIEMEAPTKTELLLG